MERTLAKVISVVFNPLIVPTYTLIILFQLDVYFSLIIPDSSKWKLILLVFSLTFLLPMLITLMFLKKGIVKSLEMETREERIFPFIITAIFYYLTYYLLKSLPIASIFYYFMLGATLLILISLIVNFFWKVSIHLTALGGMFGIFLGVSIGFLVDYPLILFGIILISGVTAYARLKLKLHTQAQVYTGFLIGAAIMLSLLIFV